MQSVGYNSFPFDGPGWVSADTAEQLAARNGAATHELYAHRLANFRQNYFGLVNRHNAINDGYSWLLFDDDSDSDGTVLTGGVREILMMSTASSKDTAEHIVPLIRFVVNETRPATVFGTPDHVANPINADTILVEDVTIEPSGHCQYFASGMLLPRGESHKSAMVMRQSFSPVFQVREGKIQFFSGQSPVTPSVNVHEDTENDLEPVRPFGDRSSMVDRFYALEKVESWIDDLLDKVPRSNYELP